jgi:hypothetical protein
MGTFDHLDAVLSRITNQTGCRRWATVENLARSSTSNGEEGNERKREAGELHGAGAYDG